ncbi:UDP-N-acetylmuramoyl-L-alanine--D-glutamate ligase [Rickettsiales bacterium]|nr:UDP-N-acetylmuramoyl-L-alanine--D-glutamate ligase [Rickettsiales bacterium]
MFVLLGFGITGKSTASFLISKGHKIAIYDDNHEPITSFIDQLQTNKGQVSHIRDIDSFNFTPETNIIVTPGISTKYVTHPLLNKAQQSQSKMMSAFDLFKQYNTKPIIGVTGTVGKSTIATLTHQIMQNLEYKSNLCGNIGIPYFNNTDDEHQYNVVELSSYELENSIEPSVDTLILSNIFPSHIYRHKTVKNYTEAKLKTINEDTTIIAQYDDQKILETLKKYNHHNNKISFFSGSKIIPRGTSFVDGKLYLDGELIESDICHSFFGEDNDSNIAAAIESIRQHENIDAKKLKSTMSTLKPLPHRAEPIRDIGNVSFINNSKGTNVVSSKSLIQALLKMGHKIIPIIGGKYDNNADQSGDENCISHINNTLQNNQSQILHVNVFGEISKLQQNQQQIISANIKYTNHDNLSNATQDAYKIALDHLQGNPSDKVYIAFTPSFQSFDEFRNFAHRGESFRQIVNSIST